jgi:integrase
LRASRLRQLSPWARGRGPPVSPPRTSTGKSALPNFYTFEEYDALVAAAERLDRRVLVAVLLGGDAGLRAGEAMGLDQTDVSRANRIITVEQQVWRGVVGTPKSGSGRTVPMTEKLAKALAAVRHLRGDRVLLQDDGTQVTAKALRLDHRDGAAKEQFRGGGVEVRRAEKTETPGVTGG